MYGLIFNHVSKLSMDIEVQFHYYTESTCMSCVTETCSDSVTPTCLTLCLKHDSMTVSQQEGLGCRSQVKASQQAINKPAPASKTPSKLCTSSSSSIARSMLMSWPTHASCLCVMLLLMALCAGILQRVCCMLSLVTSRCRGQMMHFRKPRLCICSASFSRNWFVRVTSLCKLCMMQSVPIAQDWV